MDGDMAESEKACSEGLQHLPSSKQRVGRPEFRYGMWLDDQAGVPQGVSSPLPHSWD